MRDPGRRLLASWPALAMIAGGALMVALWPIFTTLHGPTSFNEDGDLLGMDGLFWGSMMEGPTSLLIAAGLMGSRTRLTGDGGRRARVGFVLTMVGLMIPALVDMAMLAPMAPLLTPVLAAGLLLMAAGNGAGSSLTSLSRRTLAGLGALMLFAFLWTVLVRPDVIDQIYGYRIYGLGANVLFGAGWIVFGSSLIAQDRDVQAVEPAVATPGV